MPRTAVTSFIVFASLSGCAFAQPVDSLPSFEVASIRPAPPIEPGRPAHVGPRGGPGSTDPTRVVFDNMTLALLAMQAYDIKVYQLTAPSWATTDRFNIIAKVREGAAKEQVRLMLRNLLIERFSLKVHHEGKEMQIYDLVVGKSGHRLKQHVEQPALDADAAAPVLSAATLAAPPRIKIDADGYPILPPGRSGTIIESGHARWQAVNETMDTVAARLAANLARPVTNSTGLSGKYDFTLSWVPAQSNTMMGPMGNPLPPPPLPGGTTGAEMGAPTANMPEGVTLQGAIQQQLGLKLESKRGMIDTLVIDHAERVPTEN